MQPLKMEFFITMINNFRKLLGFCVKIVKLYIVSTQIVKKKSKYFALKFLEENTKYNCLLWGNGILSDLFSSSFIHSFI